MSNPLVHVLYLHLKISIGNELNLLKEHVLYITFAYLGLNKALGARKFHGNELNLLREHVLYLHLH